MSESGGPYDIATRGGFILVHYRTYTLIREKWVHHRAVLHVDPIGSGATIETLREIIVVEESADAILWAVDSCQWAVARTREKGRRSA